MKNLFLIAAVLASGTVCIPEKKSQLRSRSSWSGRKLGCNTISFTEKIDSTHSSFHGQALNQCNVISGSMQTTINLLKQKCYCSYKLIGYSGVKCRDEEFTGSFSLNSLHPVVTLNERRPVCSYRLGKRPTPGQSVKVIFGGGSVRTLTHDLTRSECYNLCSTQNDSNFPSWVGVYNATGSISKDNYVELFSELSCGDGSIIRNAKGKTAFRKNKRLDKRTLVNRNKIMRSYMIIRSR